MLAIYEISGKPLNVPTFTLQMFQKKREKKMESVFEEILPENNPNLKKKTDIQIQEAQRVPNKINPNRPTRRYIIEKMAKVKERILKAAREKVIYKGTSLKLLSDFSAETLQARSKWHNIFKVV